MRVNARGSVDSREDKAETYRGSRILSRIGVHARGMLTVTKIKVPFVIIIIRCDS